MTKGEHRADALARLRATSLATVVVRASTRGNGRRRISDILQMTLQRLLVLVLLTAGSLAQKQAWDNEFNWSKLSARIDELAAKEESAGVDEANRNWRKCCQGRGLSDVCVDLCKHGAITQKVVRFFSTIEKRDAEFCAVDFARKREPRCVPKRGRATVRESATW